MEITNKKLGTLTYKCYRIRDWKKSGVKHDDFDALFQQYINTKQCQHCAKQFKDTRDRHLDHDHTTGLFRMVVCKNCNNHDSYIKYPDGYDRKDYIKQWQEKNKDKIKARKNEKIECECVSVVRRGGMLRHKKTAKHISWRTNILRKYIEIWRYKSQR